MLINFALDVVGTKITSDKVSTDGHECSNLISNNWHLRRKGFIAEHFIKPPVNLTFEFPCNVCIHQVFVTPCVGQQLSSHIELYAASNIAPKTTHGIQKLKSAVFEVSTSSMSEGCGISNPPAVSRSLPLFYPISKIQVSNSDRICFYNPKVSTVCSNDTANDIPYQHRAEIQHFRQEIVSASSHLTLRIVRTVRGSTAAVSSIDIWGLPALSVPSSIRDGIINRYTSFINQSSAVKEISKHDKKDCKTATSVTSSVAECFELEIPEDFVDPITCEVMAVPMLLPSGNNVDLSTLDHYFNVEASYGRQPRDPFTGLQFSSSTKPIPNGALKARIDKFLIEHSSDAVTLTVARTVRPGRNTSLLGKRKKLGNSNDGVSSLISQSSSRHHLHTSIPNQIKVSINEVSKDSSSLEYQQSKPVPQPSNLLDKSGSAFCREVSLDSVKAEQTAHSCNKDGSSDRSHETHLKNSLNSALSSILSSLPSYLSNSQNTADSDLCSLCKITLSVDKVSYVTPCQHYICRECLTSDSAKSSLTCGVCGNVLIKKDVLRRHQAV